MRATPAAVSGKAPEHSRFARFENARSSVLGFYGGKRPGRLPRLREGEASVPLVVLTCAPRVDIQLALDIGALGVLAKPLDAEPVAAAIRAALRVVRRQAFRPRASAIANAEERARERSRDGSNATTVSLRRARI